MRVDIKEVNKETVGDVGKCDNEFVIDSRLVLHVEDNDIRYTIVDVQNAKKRYPPDDVDYTIYIDNPDRTIFLAYVDMQIAGQTILRRNWNKYALVEDITVDVKFRRMGIGTALVDYAKRWAKERNLPGIMLETQNNNVGACRFYESCGLKLGGFDIYLYKGINSGTDEIALYWYLPF
jgi:streptothricin acetyltransferase